VWFSSASRGGFCLFCSTHGNDFFLLASRRRFRLKGIAMPQMPVGERDKKMSEMASEAAAAFCHKYETGDKQIGSSPETYLEHSIPYLTVRTLHRLEEILKRQEEALKRQEMALTSLEADSWWIRVFAIVTGILTGVLVFLTIVLARYPLEDIIHSLSK